MSRSIFFSCMAPVLAVSLTACGSDESVKAPVEETGETESVEVETIYDASTLSAAVEAPWRSEEARIRDQYRNPADTLAFFDIDPASTVVEVWPGGGWYAEIIAPWVTANGGRYIAAWPPVAADNARAQAFQDRFVARFENDAFGSATLVDFGPGVERLGDPQSVDAIITFRNIHSVMRRGFAENAFAQFYTALRPCGVLGVVAHRQPAGSVQDPRASSGYVQQDYVVALAEEAGFELVSASEINANPADTADHPFGVWTLPPVLRTAPVGEPANPDFDSSAYLAIGESDRMTLLFRKAEPDSPDGEAGE